MNAWNLGRLHQLATLLYANLYARSANMAHTTLTIGFSSHYTPSHTYMKWAFIIPHWVGGGTSHSAEYNIHFGKDFFNAHNLVSLSVIY
jgi:hypothetical protein|uniref:Uncharacterized protein n=1 Tax=Picea glauca TaxID=3330 RepID=A0A101M5E2_PICGL|nr:hypothetical protein ABT39_MTgene1248 [Picea glauca]